jgi:protein-disulfide isomerase
MKNVFWMGLLCTVALMAQGPRADLALPGVDMSGLTSAQKVTVQKLLAARDCSCGCGMKVAECRVKDPGCAFSRGLASVIVDAVRNGKDEKQALAAADASNFAHVPGRDTRVLSDPVQIRTAGAPLLGPPDAPVKLIEFSDFQCPFCVLATPQVHRILKAYPSQVSLVFKQYPLDSHSQAALAASAALAAHKQGKFWEMHDGLFSLNGRLSRDAIFGVAAKIGLDMKKFEADLSSPEIQKTVVQDIQDGDSAGVSGTPTLFVNGKRYNANVTLEALKPILDAELTKPLTTASATR